jgi:hypothetical protein
MCEPFTEKRIMADFINNFRNKYQILTSLLCLCDILGNESHAQDHSDLTRAVCNGHALCVMRLKHVLSGCYHKTVMWSFLLRQKITV